MVCTTLKLALLYDALTRNLNNMNLLDIAPIEPTLFRDSDCGIYILIAVIVLVIVAIACYFISKHKKKAC